MNKLQHQVEETRHELGEMRSELGETQNKLGKTRHELGETQNKLGKTRNELGETQSKLGKTQNQVGEQARRILHLETTSTSVQDRIKRFSEGKYLPVDEVEKMFSLPAVFDDNALRTCCGKVRSPKEKGVQELLVEMLPILAPSSTFCDCRAPNGITFAGRRHDVDLVLFAQHVRSMETVVLPIELKLSIAGDADRRDVVLQLLDRMVYIFSAQPDRKVCWGLGFDATHVVFVRAARDLSFEVTPALQLFGDNGHRKLVAGFLQSDASSYGYIPVSMPLLWNALCVSLLAQHESGAVYALSDAKKVAKVGRSKDSVEAERDMMVWICESAPGLVCPEVFPCELSTGNATWPYGFQMVRLEVVCVSCEADVVRLAGDMFWCLAVLHELGVVHNDVKPPNMLSAETQGRTYLCDFGHAEKWRPGNGMLDVRGATESFGVVETAFANSATSMYACDMEGLYWSVMALWLQVVEKKATWRPENAATRLMDMELCSGRGLIRQHRENRVQRLLPENPLLRAYLHEQAKDQMLWEPNQLIDKYLSISNCGEDEWLAQVQSLEAETLVFPCPPRVLLWFRARRMSCNQ